MGTYPRVSAEYRYPIHIRYGHVSILEYPSFIGSYTLHLRLMDEDTYTKDDFLGEAM